MIVIEKVPKATAFVAVNVRMEVFPVVLLGLKVPVTPAGRPETLNPTEEPNPGARMMETLMALLAPGTRTCGLGLAASENPLLG